ncbi:MAG: hypothetical protein ABJD07_01180, partial [Gemmatimonadaceae bacterium]
MSAAIARRWVIALALVPVVARAQSASAPGDTVAARRYDVGSGTVLLYRRPRLGDLATGVPATLAGSARSAVRLKRWPVIAGLVGSTAMLIAFDQRILDETRRFADRIELSQSHPSIDIRAGRYKVIAIPTTISSG